MKKSQKPSKSKPKASKKPVPAKELSENDLDRVSGGAGVDYFLKLDGIKGESSEKLVPAVSVGNIGPAQNTIKWFKLT
jgi:bacteriocin-like protein